MNLFINKILHYAFNLILYKFNRCITCNTMLYIDNKYDDSREWVFYKDYFEINYNIISKTNNKNYYKIEKQINLFKYKFKRNKNGKR